jgi:short-subunit dehydrogenase
MQIKEKYGHLAMVAGASEGIGASFSKYLAAEGIDLILIARRTEPLEQLAFSLKNKYHINISVLSCDLSESGAAQFIIDSVRDREINILVYNAALSHIGRFEEDTVEHTIAIANCNMITPLTLVRVFGENMLKKGKGALILMASLAGFQGSGFLASYAATKAFNRVLAESLWYEWKNRGVDVIACCAGATSTKNYLMTKPGKSGFFAPRVQTPEEVVEECFKRLGKKPSFIAGTGNKLASLAMQRLLPRKTTINIMGDATRKIYRL